MISFNAFDKAGSFVSAYIGQGDWVVSSKILIMPRHSDAMTRKKYHTASKSRLLAMEIYLHDHDLHHYRVDLGIPGQWLNDVPGRDVEVASKDQSNLKYT